VEGGSIGNAQEPFFGRTELEWEELEVVGWELLAGRTAKLTSFTELNRALARVTGQPPCNFSSVTPVSARVLADCQVACALRSAPVRSFSFAMP